MFRIFNRHRSQTEETAPQLTRFERNAFSIPGSRFGLLGYETYDEMQKDSMVQTVLTLKRLAVVSGGFTLEPSGDHERARRVCRFVEEAFARMEGSPLDVLRNAMDAFAKGWSVQETVYRLDGGRIWIETVRPKDPSLFGLKVDRFGRIEGLTLRLPGEGETSLDPSRFLVYMNRRNYAQPKGRSDLDAAYRHWQAKQGLLAAWKLHLEKFAMPTVLGRFERGLPSDEQASLLRALQDVQNNTAVTFPSEIEVSLLGGGKEPSTGFQEAIEFHNREIARAVLGQTLTTDEGRRVGSLALGKVHLQILLLQVNAIRRELAETVMTEQLVRPLVEANFGPGDVPRFVLQDSGVDAFSSGELR
ncbi:MAG: DUF935 family protein [Armatimonadetes bacterium]|nr:DUF935 family protein [Armatimonadota bacterium]